MKRKTILFLSCFLSLFFFWQTHHLKAQSSFQSPGGPNEVNLKNRVFIPDPVNSMTTTSFGSGSHYVFLQFNSPLDAGVLGKAGLPCLGRISDNTVMTRVPGGFNFGNVPDLRYAGKLTPTDRMSTYAQEELDQNGSDPHTMLVYMQESLAASDKGAMLTAAGGSELTHPNVDGNRLLVTGSVATFDQLAQDERIAWIVPASKGLKNGEFVHFCDFSTHADPCDNVPFANPGGDGSDNPLFFVTNGAGWDGPGQGCAALTYHFVNGTPDIDMLLEHNAIRGALSQWADYVDITFTETATPGLANSIDFLWGFRDHGDVPFSSTSREFAHAFAPSDIAGEPLAGDVHFNENENWYLRNNGDPTIDNRPELISHALHLIGHALGLNDSDDPTAVMSNTANWKNHTTRQVLQLDDVFGIKALYHASGWEHGYIIPSGDNDYYNVKGDIEAHDGQVRYRMPSGHMGNMYYSGGQWNQGVIAPNYFDVNERIKAGGAIAVDQSSGQTYYHGNNDKLQNMHYSGGQWNHGYPNVSWTTTMFDVDGEIEVAPNNGDVRYRASNGRIVNKAWVSGGTGWTTAFIGPASISNSWRMKSGASLGIGSDGQTFYQGEDGRIQNWRISGGSWVHGWVAPNWTNSTWNVKDGGDIEVGSGVIYYHGIDNKLHTLFYAGGTWNHAWVAPDFASEDWDVDGDIEIAPNGQVRYRLKNGRIANMYLSGGVWNRGILEPYWGGNDWNMVAGGAMSIGQDGQTFYHAPDDKMHNYHWVAPCTGKTGGESSETEQHEVADAVLAGPVLKAAPNPFVHQLQLKLELTTDTELTIEIMDVQGRVVDTPVARSVQAAGNRDFTVDTSRLPAGMYFVRMQYADQSQTIKVVKANQ